MKQSANLIVRETVPPTADPVRGAEILIVGRTCLGGSHLQWAQRIGRLLTASKATVTLNQALA
ncbi:hypothetical protein AGR7B_pAt0173 [Agrobacterium deltaense RV3]|nr:hypothetical protein AGR7B_pAt0173 [Agrobacterium deltaense RV3]